MMHSLENDDCDAFSVEVNCNVPLLSLPGGIVICHVCCLVSSLTSGQ